MPGWEIPAAIAGGAVISSAAQYFGQKSANKANERIARENRAFQDRQSSTSWRRGVEDLKAAGLNPMLAYSQGGASTSPGSTAHMESELKGVGEGLSKAIEIARAGAMVDLQKQQKKVGVQQEALTSNSAKVAKTQMEILKARLPAEQAEAQFRRKKAGIDETMAVPDAIMQRANQATGVMNNVKQLLNPFQNKRTQSPWAPKRGADPRKKNPPIKINRPKPGTYQESPY